MEEPFVERSRAVAIKYTGNANFSDLSQLPVASYYKYIADNRFLLNPGNQDATRSTVRFKNIDMDGAVAVGAVCEIAHSQSPPIRCGSDVICNDSVVAGGEVLAQVEENCRLSVTLPPHLARGDVVVCR